MSQERREILNDPALGTAGIFRPLRKRKERDKLSHQMTWGKASIHWRSPDALGISDQSVLFAVLEVADEQLRSTSGEVALGEGDRLWALLSHEQHVFRQDTLRVATSFSRLAILCGWGDGGASIQRVKAALRRLTETTVWVKLGDQEGSSRLLAWQVGDRRQVQIALNWRLAQALRGEQYARISMAERASLHTEVAQALHAVLCCKVNIGKAWDCRVDSLQRYVWGNAVEEGDNLRARRRRLCAALKAIDNLSGWGVRFDDDKVHIGRGHSAGVPDGYPSYQSRSVPARRISHKSPSLQSCTDATESSAHAGFELVDVSVLFSTRE